MRKTGRIRKCLYLLYLKGIAKTAGMVIILLSLINDIHKLSGGGFFQEKI
jgi:hypothetical protein